MTYEKFNEFCKSLPKTTHVVQWGGSDVWKIGGKLFAVGRLGEADKAVFTFKASENNFNFLQNIPGYRMASRGMKWIQCYDSANVKSDELEYYLSESYRIVSLGLTKKLQAELGLNQG